MFLNLDLLWRSATYVVIKIIKKMHLEKYVYSAWILINALYGVRGITEMSLCKNASQSAL